jgi:hypothetical protein
MTEITEVTELSVNEETIDELAFTLTNLNISNEGNNAFL